MLIHSDGQGVLGIKINNRGNIELIWVSAALRISDFLSVYPYMESSINALKPESKLTVLELFRNLKLTYVRSSLVLSKRNVWRIDWDVINDVRILGAFAESL